MCLLLVYLRPSASAAEGQQECPSYYIPVVPVCGTTAATQLTFRLKAAACTGISHIHQRWL